MDANGALLQELRDAEPEDYEIIGSPSCGDADLTEILGDI